MSYDSYMREAFNNPREHIKDAVGMIRKHKLKFDSIAVSGVSGLTFGSMLAFHMRKNLVVVRTRLSEHSIYSVLYGQNIGTYLFVDDLIDTGKTLRRVVNNIRRESRRAKLIGAYLYNDNCIESLPELQEYLTKR